MRHKAGTHASKTVLIVDDDSLWRATLSKFLTARGYFVLEADSGHCALELIQKESVDLIISDIQMPNGDGLEMLKELRASSQACPPVIFMSGGVALTNADLRALGAVQFLPKPFNVESLLSAINLVVDRAA